MGRKKSTSSTKTTPSILDKLKKLRIDDVGEEEVKEERVYRPLGKYLKVKQNDKQEKFVTMGKRVQNGEVASPYFTTENGKGVFYYEVLK